ncbi:MAG: PDZ domain-containing protein [Planctomycetia bacterium]
MPAGREVEVRAQRSTPEKGVQDLPPQRIRFEAIPTATLARERLGLEVADVGDYEAGVLVRTAGGPAAKVGLQPGDVIVGLGTRRIRHTDDLLVFLQFVRPGDLVDVHVRRAAAGGREVRELSGSLKAE